MKKYFVDVIKSKAFDAVLGMLLFFFAALSFDYATDETLTGQSLLFDLLYSFLLGLLLFFRPTKKKLSNESLKHRSDKVELIGKVLIGFLLFMVFLALTVYKLR